MWRSEYWWRAELLSGAIRCSYVDRLWVVWGTGKGGECVMVSYCCCESGTLSVSESLAWPHIHCLPISVLPSLLSYLGTVLRHWGVDSFLRRDYLTPLQLLIPFLWHALTRGLFRGKATHKAPYLLSACLALMSTVWMWEPLQDKLIWDVPFILPPRSPVLDLLSPYIAVTFQCVILWTSQAITYISTKIFQQNLRLGSWFGLTPGQLMTGRSTWVPPINRWAPRVCLMLARIVVMMTA